VKLRHLRIALRGVLIVALLLVASIVGAPTPTRGAAASVTGIAVSRVPLVAVACPAASMRSDRR
jgi:hypothetical protein